MAVPEGSTDLQLPPISKGNGASIYQRSRDKTADGLEIWDLLEMWNSTGLAPP